MWPGSAAWGVCVALTALMPLALKWRLPLGTAAVWSVLSGAVLGPATSVALGPAPSAAWLAGYAAVLSASTAAVTSLAFMRDPERRAPEDADAIVSPADGEVVYVRRFPRGAPPPVVKKGRRVETRELIRGRGGEAGLVVGIGMNLLDVHVNRAPIGGSVAFVTRAPGRFMSLRREEAVALNERVVTVLEGEGLSVAVVQIASRLVRRIVAYVKQGDAVSRGERIGMIRFGSQVDLVLPDTVEIAVRVGDRVRAGETVVARAVPASVEGETGRARGVRPRTPGDERLEAPG